MIWRDLLPKITERPVLGFGLLNVTVKGRYAGETPHNAYLAQLLYYGSVGFVAFMMMLVGFGHRVYSSVVGLRGRPEAWVLTGLLVGVAGQGMVEYIITVPLSFSNSLFWLILAPWWNFPGGRVDDRVSLLGHLTSTHLPIWALMLWMVMLGTIVPFALVVGALRHITATRAGITAMLEPVVAIVVAWAWLGESLDPVQLSGAAATLAGISLAQTSR